MVASLETAPVAWHILPWWQCTRKVAPAGIVRCTTGSNGVKGSVLWGSNWAGCCLRFDSFQLPASAHLTKVFRLVSRGVITTSLYQLTSRSVLFRYPCSYQSGVWFMNQVSHDFLQMCTQWWVSLCACLATRMGNTLPSWLCHCHQASAGSMRKVKRCRLISLGAAPDGEPLLNVPVAHSYPTNCSYLWLMIDKC